MRRSNPRVRRKGGHKRLFAVVAVVAAALACSAVVHSTMVALAKARRAALFGNLAPLQIKQRPSPNYDARPLWTDVDTIVLHATVIDSLESTCCHFENPNSGVSSHYTVDKDGTIVQHVPEDMRARHAGVSQMPDGRASVNDFSIGIEIVNLNDGDDPYPPEQLKAVHDLIMHICSRHPIKHIVSHREIALPPGRKSDPRGFDWSILVDIPLEDQPGVLNVEWLMA